MPDDLHLTGEDDRIEAILRSLSADDLEFDTPPESVWAGIEAAVDPPASAPAAEVAPAPVIDLASRRRRPVLIGAVAAALVVIAGLAVVLVADDAEPVEVAAAELVHVPDDPGFVELGVGRHVDVTLIDDGGTEAVRIDGADLPATGDEGDLELWFLAFRGDDLDIIPLGILEDPSDPGTFAVPDDFDRSAYDTIAVDISIEPRDGNEAHSGMSLVRGTLTA